MKKNILLICLLLLTLCLPAYAKINRIADNGDGSVCYEASTHSTTDWNRVNYCDILKIVKPDNSHKYYFVLSTTGAQDIFADNAKLTIDDSSFSLPRFVIPSSLYQTKFDVITESFYEIPESTFARMIAGQTVTMTTDRVQKKPLVYKISGKLFKDCQRLATLNFADYTNLKAVNP